MFCPRCSQEQIGGDARFCSRCGFLMTGVSQLLAGDGMLPQLSNSSDLETPRKKGIKRGGKLMLLSLIIVPLLAILSVALGMRPTLAALAAIITFWGGLLRIIYALIFESNKPTGEILEESIKYRTQKLFGRKKANTLPPSQMIPVGDYISPVQGSWLDTDDLVRTSVTEETTGLLRED